MSTKKKVITFSIDDDEWFGVTAISLVDLPAIEKNFVALRGHEVKLSAVDGERRMLYGPALIPDKEILRVDKETKEEYYIKFPPDTVMKAAHLFLKKNQHHNHTIMHQFAVEGLTVVESWIKEGDQDKSVELGIDVPVNTWMIGVKVDDDAIWEEVKAGSVKGFSIEGFFSELHAATNMSAIREAMLLDEIENVLKNLEG